MNKKVSLIFAVIVILLTGGFFTFLFIQGMNEGNPVNINTAIKNNKSGVCTQEAKLCPNGTSVGRIGPNCEFTPCPSGNLVGNDKDEHGCIGSAGYSWCEEKQKCFRSWEESCALPNSLIYKNTDYGFQVTLLKGWEKFQVSIQRDKGDDKHTYFYFMMPTTDKSWVGSYDKNTEGVIPGMVDIFVITANDLATWNTDLNSKECKENPNPSCPYEGSVIAKNGKYVFDASYGNGLLPPDVQKFRVGKSAFEFLSGKFKFLD